MAPRCGEIAEQHGHGGGTRGVKREDKGGDSLEANDQEVWYPRGSVWAGDAGHGLGNGRRSTKDQRPKRTGRSVGGGIGGVYFQRRNKMEGNLQEALEREESQLNLEISEEGE